MDQKENLENRLRNVIVGTCNTIGCKDCSLKWTEDGKEKCSALDLQNKLYDLEKETK